MKDSCWFFGKLNSANKTVYFKLRENKKVLLYEYTPPPGPGKGVPPIQTWEGDTPLNVNRQTAVKTVPSCHTTYAGGNKLYIFSEFNK